MYAWWDMHAVERLVRDNMRKQKAEGKLPPHLQQVDIDNIDLGDFMVRVPPELISRTNMARFVAASWFLWAPAIILVCLGVDALVRRFATKGAAAK